MPRTYVKKKPGCNYTTEDILRAVRDVENRNCTFKEAQERYGVPKSVIFYRMKGRKTPLEKLGAGRPTVLSSLDELDLVNCIKARARMGYPCDKPDVINIVAQFVKANNIKSPFSDGVPGNDWYYGFLHRHPSLSFKKPELLQKNRKDARKPDVIYDFYSELNQLTNQCGLTCEEKSCFLFNCDESGFNTDPMRVKAIGETGSPLTRIVGGSGRESITVLATISADGGYLPPFIVYKGASVQARWVSPNPYPGTLYSASSNGWMEEPQFFEWLSHGFVPHVKNLRESKKCPDQKAILLYDGHTSHISYRIIKLAMDNQIELMKLPSHLTDKIQPLDKCVFAPIKKCWEKKLINFGKKQIEKQGNCRLSKCDFATLIGKVWKEAMLSKNVVSGFNSTGLFPVDAMKFPESAFNPNDLQRYKKSRALVLVSQPSSNVMIQNCPEHTETSWIQVSSIPANTSSNTSCEQLPNLHEYSEGNFGKRKETQETPKKSPQKGGKITPKTPTGIIEIFASSMKKNHESYGDKNHIVKKERKIPRLKPERYGEVLTTEAVLAKVKEVEDKKKRVEEEKEAKKLERASKNLKKTNLKRKLNFNTCKLNKSSPMEDSESEDILESLAREMLIEHSVEIDYEEPNWSKIQPGKFVLVDFIGGSRNTTHYKYVCCVQSTDEEYGEIRVCGYERLNDNSTQFVVKENDDCVINFNQVLAILPEPTVKEIDRKVVHEFSGTVSVFQK